MSQAVLCRKSEPAVPAQFTMEFGFNDANYRVKIEVEMVPTLASVPCGKCAKTTRELLTDLGVKVPTDDQKVDVLELVSSIPHDRSRSVLDSEHVSFIKHVFVLEIEDIHSLAEISSSNPLFKEIEDHIKKVLTGLVTCNGCAYNDDYLEELLKS